MVVFSGLSPDKVVKGSYLSFAAELNSFNDVLEAFKTNGINYSSNYVPVNVFYSFFEGAGAVAQLLSLLRILFIYGAKFRH
jgi:hypothetical protein